MEYKDELFNGKKIGDIFAQRGKQVYFHEMEEGKVYLLTKKDFEWDLIQKHERTEREKLWNKGVLFDDGSFVEEGFINAYNEGAFFLATPDQIALLGSKIKEG